MSNGGNLKTLWENNKARQRIREHGDRVTILYGGGRQWLEKDYLRR